MEIADLVYQKDNLNLELLHAELKAGLGDGFVGVSSGPMRDTVRVHVEAAVDVDLAAVAQIVDAHDGAKKSARQQREEDLDRLRARLKKRWVDFDDADRETLMEYIAKALGVTDESEDAPGGGGHAE